MFELLEWQALYGNKLCTVWKRTCHCDCVSFSHMEDSCSDCLTDGVVRQVACTYTHFQSLECPFTIPSVFFFFAVWSRDICNEVVATAVPYVRLPIFYRSIKLYHLPTTLILVWHWQASVAFVDAKWQRYIKAWQLTFPALYDLIVIVDHQMHHARHGRYQWSLSETKDAYITH